MQTIFIMLSRGIVARNILRTDVFKILREARDVRLVIFVPPGMPQAFRQEFSSERVILEECNEPVYPRYRKAFEAILQKLVYTDTARFFMKHGGRWTKKRNKNKIGAIAGNLGAELISRMTFLKRPARFIEYHFFSDKMYDKYFLRYKPNLVVSTTIKTKRDIAILKSAKRFNVPNIGMARSWDNLDRVLIAVRPQKLIVQNEVMKGLAERLHAIPARDVFVSGFPQFDVYHKKEAFMAREDFLISLGLDPRKKTIMFASEGVWAPYGHLAAKLLYEMIQAGDFGDSCNLIVRPHFSDLEENKYVPLLDDRLGVFVDKHFRSMKFFTDKWDPSYEEMVHLANELKHSDVLVTYATTLAIEASIVDTPVVNINFRVHDEPEDGPFFGMFYGSSHYSNVVRTGGVKIAGSKEEMREYINQYLLHPEYEREQRGKTAELLAYKQDGKAGERVGKFILERLANSNE